MKKYLCLLVIAFTSLGVVSHVFSEHHEKNSKESVESKGVFFQNLKDGQEVKSPLKVEMEVKGKVIKPAGELSEGAGHHHLIIDGASIPEGAGVPMDETHIHFGKGQTETEVSLTPGEHTLTLQLADGMHRSYGPAWSKTISVTVVE